MRSGGDRELFERFGCAWARPLLVAAGFAVIVWGESRRPLRAAREPRRRRFVRNIAIGATGAVAVRFFERPIVQRLAVHTASRGWGLVPRLGLPRWVADVVAVALLDYTLFVWHALNHRQSLLWRFHGVHHADRDLDASTALRFHFGELLLSVPWRAAQVVLIGATPRALALWQSLLFASVVFHHSNLRLPRRLESVLSRLIVTPRLHGIHHSERPEHQSSNLSSGLSLWDWLHGTIRRDVPQSSIQIGLPAPVGSARSALAATCDPAPGHDDLL